VRSRISPREMRRHGWVRVDARPWWKTNARWLHRSGWRLHHCGHPTALWPWELFTPSGERVLTGVVYGKSPRLGTAWRDLRSAVEWVAKAGASLVAAADCRR
jgi:hypothetical protein